MENRIQSTTSSSTVSPINRTLQDPVESTSSHQQQLTQYNEAENEVFQSSQEMDLLTVHKRIANPYPFQTPSQLLSRSYQLGSITVGTAWTGVRLDFPAALFAMSTISDALLTFLFFRAAIKLEVRMNSTPFQMGAIMISWLPCPNTSTYVPDIWAASGNHPVVISVSTQDAATIEIPYLNPLTWLRWATTNASSIASVWFQPLVPLVIGDPNSGDTVTLSVFASFVNPEVAGYVHSSTTNRRKAITRESLFHRHDPQPERPTERKPVPHPKKYVQSQSSDLIPPKVTEAVTKLSTASQDVANGIQTAASPILRMVDTVASIFANPLDVFRQFTGLDKPDTSGVTSNVQQRVDSDLCHGTGLSESRTLSLYPNPLLSLDASLLPGETSLATVTSLAMIPMLHAVINFTNVTTNASIVAIPRNLLNTSYQPDYLMFISDAFQYWRGSIKYLFHFVTNAFTTCRFRVSINYTTWATPDVAISGDVASKVVDVKGDTFLELVVPYLFDTHWRKVNDTSGYPRIVVEELTPVIGQSLDSDCSIYCVIWRSAGEDFQFAQLQTVDPGSLGVLQLHTTTPSTETNVLHKIQSQSAIRGRFAKPFAPIIQGCGQSHEKGFVASEVIGDLGACLKRYQEVSAPYTYPWLALFDTGVSDTGAFLHFSQMFLFWRGSRRLKKLCSIISSFAETGADDFISVQTSVSPGPATSGYYSFSDGTAYVNYNLNSCVDATIPYYCTYPYVPTNPNLTTIDGYSGDLFPMDAQSYVPDNYSIFHYLIAAGDDFSYLSTYAPPVYASLTKRNPKRPSQKVAKDKPTSKLDPSLLPISTGTH